MKLPNWILIFSIAFMAMAHYGVQAHAKSLQGSSALLSGVEFVAMDLALANNEVTSMTLNINTASAKELSNLPGIGLKKAQAIIEYRERNGEFVTVDELVNVKGIGSKMLAKLDGKISI